MSAIFIYVRLNTQHVHRYVTCLQEEEPLCCHGDRQNERQWRAGGALLKDASYLV